MTFRGQAPFPGWEWAEGGEEEGEGRRVKLVALDSSCRKLALNPPIPPCQPPPMMAVKSPTQLVPPAPWAFDSVIFGFLFVFWLFCLYGFIRNSWD